MRSFAGYCIYSHGKPRFRAGSRRSGEVCDEDPLDTTSEVISMLQHVLGLGDRVRGFTRDTRLLGAIPEIDSMAVVSLLTSMEERYGFAIADDEIDGSAFATVGSLSDFIEAKLAQ